MIASGRISSLMHYDVLFLLMLEWFDAADLAAFDAAVENDRCMGPAWLRAIRGLLDMKPLIGLVYTPLWIIWLIDRGVQIGRASCRERVLVAV